MKRFIQLAIFLLFILIITSCNEPRTVYVMAQPPALESPQQVTSPDSPPKLDQKYVEAMRRDPCYVASALTGAVSIDTDAMNNRMIKAESFANRFACMWEKQNYEEMYSMFSKSLQSRRSLESFINIMTHLQFKNMQPYAIRIDDIDFFENATVAHVYFSTDYRMTTADLEKTKEPRMVIHFKDNEWECGNMIEVFFEYCSSSKDCEVDLECEQKCADIGLQAESKCVPIVNECSCYCTEGIMHEISFYDLTPRDE